MFRITILLLSLLLAAPAAAQQKDVFANPQSVENRTTLIRPDAAPRSNETS